MANPWQLVELDRKGMQQWLETRTAMQYTQAGLTAILYSMMNRDKGESVFWFTEDIPTLAVDGRRIWANPAYLFGLPLQQRIAAGFHEVLHGVLHHEEQLHWHRKGNHPVVWLTHSMPFDVERCVRAMDHCVNANLVEGKVGELKEGWLYDPAIATSRTTWQEAYYRLWVADGCPQPQPDDQGQGGQRASPQNAGPPASGQDPSQPGGLPQPGGQGPPQTPQPPAGTTPGKGEPQPLPPGYEPELAGPQDYHAAPGTSQGKAADDPGVAVNETEWKVAIKAALAAGTLPAGLVEPFEKLVESKATWTDHLQGLLARGLGGGGYNWRKPDRRFLMRNFYLPARSGKGCGTIVVVGDSSGSIYAVKGLVDRIFAETRGVLEQVKPREIVLLWCDAKIQRVDWLDDPHDLEVTWRKGAEGGGGTKFKPAFKWVADNLDDVDALVYFTDGENFDGDPGKPDYPVVWGHIGKKTHKYPWGDRVDIPTDGSA